MTTEYKAQCPLCPFHIIDDAPNPEKIIKRLIKHGEIAHKQKFNFKNMEFSTW